jgi:hypothetical protein
MLIMIIRNVPVSLKRDVLQYLENTRDLHPKNIYILVPSVRELVMAYSHGHSSGPTDAPLKQEVPPYL